MGSTPTQDTPFLTASFRQGIQAAVISAGVSGICAGAHLIKRGADVTVFERSSVSSGVWHFDPRTDAESTEYPSRRASAGDYRTSVPEQFLPEAAQGLLSEDGRRQHPLNTINEDTLEVAFAPPGPCYYGLKNNIPTTLLYSSLKPWPAGTEENVSHWEVERYLQDLGVEHGVDKVTLYRTRVEEAKKSVDGSKWILRTITLLGSDGSPRIVERTFNHPTTVLPRSVKRVGEIARFVLDTYIPAEARLGPSESIPGQIILNDGEAIRDIHHVVIAAGYITSCPFLAQFHEDDTFIDDAGNNTLVTSEGNMVHNLHKDIFYIPDPSLSFIGIPYYISTFSLFDFQAQAVARVITGKTRLPSRNAMRREYDSRVSTKGRGRNFHSLAEEGAECVNVKNLVEWVNGEAIDPGVQPMEGHTREWLDTQQSYKDRRSLLRQGSLFPVKT